MKDEKKQLAPEQRNDLLSTLRARFEKNYDPPRRVRMGTSEAKADGCRHGTTVVPR